MPTLLTTPKMPPELRARVEAAVRGRSRSAVPRRRGGPALVALLRLTVLASVVIAAVLYVMARKRDASELDVARAALLATLAGHSGALGADDFALLARATALVQQAAEAYPGDLVAEELRAPGALDALLARPALYLRATDRALHAPDLAEAARESSKDAFVTCLLAPPAARTEKGQLAQVRVAYSSAVKVEALTPRVRAWYDLEVGLPFLAPEYAARVRKAGDVTEVERLKRTLDLAPIERAKAAAKSRVAWLVIDEPGTGTGPTELDGERAHDVRVFALDLEQRRALVRLRTRVDPAWISVERRPEYAAGLDACSLALTVRDRIAPPPAVAEHAK